MDVINSFHSKWINLKPVQISSFEKQLGGDEAHQSCVQMEPPEAAQHLIGLDTVEHSCAHVKWYK